MNSFCAYKPLLLRLKTLRMQKKMAERGGMGMPMGTESLDPVAKELQQVLGALRTALIRSPGTRILLRRLGGWIRQ